MTGFLNLGINYSLIHAGIHDTDEEKEKALS
jgi:hypothetical protein